MQLRYVIGFLMVGLLPWMASGQVVGNGVAAYDPQIDTVNSGALLDVQATVSADRKYVTLTMRPQLSTLVGFFTFQFSNPTSQPTGVVGAGNGNGGGVGVNPPRPPRGGNIRNSEPQQRPLVRRAPTLLDQEGMTFIAVP